MRKGKRSSGRVVAPNSGKKANMWKMQQAMQDDAIRTARIHPAVHPGNRDEVFIWQNFQPAYRDLGNRASLPSHMITSKILQRI